MVFMCGRKWEAVVDTEGMSEIGPHPLLSNALPQGWGMVCRHEFRRPSLISHQETVSLLGQCGDCS